MHVGHRLGKTFSFSDVALAIYISAARPEFAYCGLLTERRHGSITMLFPYMLALSEKMAARSPEGAVCQMY